MVYNCGNVSFMVSLMLVVDGFIKEDTCEYWIVFDVFTSFVMIPVGGLQLYIATM